MSLVAALMAVLWASVAPAGTVPTLATIANPTIDAGGDHNIAIGADGKLRVWGDNENGGLGDGTLEKRMLPVSLPTTQNWVAVSAGERHTMAIASDGSLWVWGWNGFGQLGTGGATTSDETRPFQLYEGETWKAVSAGYGFSVALRSDGALYAWGDNTDGQLGIGNLGPHSVRVRVNDDSDWVAIAAGDYHVLALKADGSLWAWGYNYYGQVGNNSTVACISPVRIGVENSWVAIAAGEYSSYAIKSDGSLWAWGLNDYSQLSDGTTTNKLTPGLIGAALDWVAVAAGGKHALAIKADGTLWAWGQNTRGELGDGTTDPRGTMEQVGTGTAWAAVTCGRDHSVALTTAGDVWAWGYNFNGQIGDGTTTERHTPWRVYTGIAVPVTATTTTTSASTTTTTSTTTSSTTSSTTTTASTTTTTEAPTFTDVPASYAYHDAIIALSARHVISGYGDGTFHPNEAVLRQQFAKMIVGAMGLKVTESDWLDSNPPFKDLGPDSPTSLYPHDYIAVAKKNGLTEGKTATTFAPLANITRAQLVTMVVRAAQHSGVPLKLLGSDYDGTFVKYNDKNHGDNVKLADYNGLLKGLQVSGSPAAWISATAKRGEVAQVLWNLIKLSEE